MMRYDLNKYEFWSSLIARLCDLDFYEMFLGRMQDALFWGIKMWA